MTPRGGRAPSRMATPRRLLPGFLGIGALKAGTTYLDELVRPHPEVALPAYMKETDYFSRNYNRGERWYEEQFGVREAGIFGEFSPSYVGDPACIPRILQANPDVKIIMGLRHPEQRLVSQYRHWVQETGYPKPMDEFVTEHPGALALSCYHSSLAPWLSAFPLESFYFVVFEEMISDTLPIVSGLYSFLGVSRDFVPGSLGKAFNVTVAPRFPRSYHLAKGVSRALYSHGWGRAVSAAKRLGADRALKRQAASAPPGDPQSSVAVAQEVRALFRADADEFGRVIGRDLVALWRL